MALSGSVKTNAYNGRYLELTWTATQNVGNNTSKVSWTLKGAGNAGSTWYRSGPFQITVNGSTTTVAATDPRLQLKNGTIVKSGSTTITHNDDGTKSFTITIRGAIYSYAYNCTGTKSFTLDTIPRGTTPTFSASSVNMGASIGINLPRAVSSYTHTLSYSFGSLTDQTAGLEDTSDVGTSTVFVPPMNLANQIPNASTGTCIFTCRTYDGSTLVGTKTATLKINVPATAAPTFMGMSFAEATPGISEKFGSDTLVQNKSSLQIGIAATPKYGATIEKCETTILGIKYTGTTFTTGVITASGSIAIDMRITDSRGFTITRSESLEFQPYETPSINSFRAYRIDTSGDEDDEGNRLAIEANYSISSIRDRNDKTFAVKYKISGSSGNFITIDSGTGEYSYSGTMKFTSSPDISPDNAYQIRFEISDFFTTTVYEIELPTAFPLIDFRSTGNGVEFGAVSREDCFGVTFPAKFRKNLEVGGTFSASNIKFGTDFVTPVENTPTAKVITFDEAFENEPHVFVTLRSNVPGTTITGIAVNDISKNGFTVYITSKNTTDTYFSWLAIS